MTPNVMTEGVYKKTAGGKGRRRGEPRQGKGVKGRGEEEERMRGAPRQGNGVKRKEERRRKVREREREAREEMKEKESEGGRGEE